MPKRKQGEVQHGEVQDFELIQLLIQEVYSGKGASTSIAQRGKFESFKARFQSYIDQIPSYLHSVSKEGFFPHFFLGSFSILPDTQIAEKLGVKKVYFRFDTAKTLKVVVVKNSQIRSDADAIQGIGLFSISEDGNSGHQFTSGELEDILKENLHPDTGRENKIDKVRGIKDRIKGTVKSKLVQINKSEKSISVETQDKEILDSAASHRFHEIKKEEGIWKDLNDNTKSKPEDYIAELTDSNVEKVKKSSGKVLSKISEVYSKHKGSFIYADKAREAAHHGFVAGALVNFRYRYNLRVYLEQFAGRGYADIVLVPRGKDRSLNAVPIIIELKAGTAAGTTPGSALEQAKGYAKGFQPNTMRVLTVSDNVLCVGLNLDSTEKFSMYISPPRERGPAPPTIQKLLEVTSSWNGERSTINDITEKIKQPLERIYHTFPGTPEKGGNYFSRFLLGQLLLANEFERIHLEKSVFLYNEYPLASSTRSGAQSTERPVTTFMLTKGNQGQDKEVFIFHIREGGKGEFSEKKIPINLPAVGKITEVCISLQEERKSDFFNAEKVNRYNSLNEYKQGKSFFGGEWKNIPYPDELKEKFDAVLESQLVSSQDRSQSIGKYKELFGRLGEAVLPFKVLIEREAHTQAVFHGAFSHYSDIKLGESQENRALVLMEFQTGRGKRIDMVVHGIKFADQASSAKEYDPVGLELKGPREGKTANALKDEANKQIGDEYTKGVTYKTLTDGKEVDFVGVVFDKGASNADSLILMSKDEFASVKVVHSSIFSFSQQQPGKRFDPNSCVGQSSRSKRSINNCLFSKGDVEKFSKGNIDENNVDKIKIDSEKFLTYVKNSQDEGKNAQLIEFIGNKNIEGDYKYLVDKVIGDQGYERYIQNERIKDLQGDVLQQNSGLTKNPKLKSRLMNAAGGIQLIRGIHGAIVSCKDGTATDCGLNLGGIGWSFVSQPIENVMVKTAPKVVTSAGRVVGRIIPGTLGRQTKFAVKLAGVKFGSTIAKGAAGAVAGVFDIIEIGISANNLVDCKNREGSDNPCGEKEIRDNIASIAFSGVSFVSGVALTAASLPGVGIGVGFGLMVTHGVYSGISNIIEYEKKYDTTHGENLDIFLHTLLFSPMPYDLEHLAARNNMVNSQAKRAWEALSDSPNDVVAYGVGFGVDSDTPSLHAGYGKILMNRTDADTTNLSRVIPDPIQNATMICLPQVTSEVYEKGIKKSVPTAVHHCENTMVIADRRRMQNGTIILYNLESIDEGTIVGSNTLNNYFLIFRGNTGITGGNNTVNKFILVKPGGFSGKIIGGSNATNILDLSQSTEYDFVQAKIDYRFRPNAPGLLRLTTNLHRLINDYVDSNVDAFRYSYIGRQNKTDNVLCTYNSRRLTRNDNRDVFINSGGGLSKNEKDTVDNCKKVAIAPYTKVTGAENDYTFYIKTTDYEAKDLYSEIDVKGTGTVIFPETNLLDDCDEISYFSTNNTLSLKIGLGQGNQYTLDIKNYIKQGSNQPNFMLIDKNGSNIIPKIEKLESSITKINSFELHTEHSLDSFDAAENHYKEILSNNKDYKVFGVVRAKLQSNSAFQHMVFGSSGEDIINFDQRSMFARGGNGSDMYVIDSNTEKREIIIDNNSDDKKLDMLVMPEVPEEFSIQQCNLHLNYSNTRVQVRNYLQGNSYRHLMVMNSKGETFIPYVQSMSCAGSSIENGKLVPFFHATPTQNMFLLPKDFEGDHVVIDSSLKDIEQYKDEDDLLLTREGEIPFIIRVEDFYNDQSKWRDVNFLLWNNGNFFPYLGLQQAVDGIMDYQDKLKNDYEKIIKEYVIDFTKSINITHNQDGTLTSVGQDEERIGVVILKDITPDRIRVSSINTDLVFSDEVSNHVVNVKNWNNSESYRISTLEFDLGLEPIIIRRLDRFSLSDIAEMQDLINKASEICQKKAGCEANIEAKNNDGQTLFHVAVQEGKLSSIRFLIGKIESMNFEDNLYAEPDELVKAVRQRERLKSLINEKDKFGYTPLQYAAKNGKWDIVNLFLDKTAERNQDDVADKDKFSTSWTTVHYAVYNGNMSLFNDIFQFLSDKETIINTKDSSDWTPLYYAVYYNALDVVKFLVNKGADINAKDKNGKTPLDLAVQGNETSVAEFLKQTQLDKKLLFAVGSRELDEIKNLISQGANLEAKYGDGSTPLYIASQNNYLDVLEYLVKSGANLEAKNRYGRTPLFIASWNGHLDIVKYLVENGANLEAKDYNGRTPLCFVSAHGRLDIVKWLVENGANLEAKDYDGETPLYLASVYGRLDVVKYLVSKGADIDADNNGKTSLDIARYKEHSDIIACLQQAQLDNQLLTAVRSDDLNTVKDLVARGASLEAKDKDGKTPLGIAIDKKHNNVERYLRQVQLDKKLLFAVGSRELNEIKNLISQGANLEVKYGDGSTPLYIASQNNYLDVLEYLVKSGANLEAKDRHGRTPLFIASWNGHLDIVKYLVENGANLETGDYNGRTPLCFASAHSRLDIVKWLVENGANLEAKDYNDETPLYLASVYGRLDVVKYLISKGANIDADNGGKTSLDIARYKGHSDIVVYLQQTQLSLDKQLFTAVQDGNLNKVKDLVSRGANLDAIDIHDATDDNNHGWTPILYAAKGSKWDVVKLLISNGAKFNNEITYQGTPLHFAVQENDLGMVQFLLNKGAKVESEDSYNRKPLHLAAEVSGLNIMKLLLGNGANVDAIDMYRQTPLYFAIDKDKSDVVKLLLDSGANVDVVDVNGQTPLYLAKQERHAGIVKILEQAKLNQELLTVTKIGDLSKVKDSLKQGADINAEDKDGNTSLHNAASKGYLNVVQYLIEKGASLEAKDHDSRTPIYDASWNGHLDIVKCLIEKGVNVNATDKNGWTPLHWAASKGNLEIAKSLIEKGADINAKNIYGKKPIHRAAEKNYETVIELLLSKGANVNDTDKSGWTPLHWASQNGHLDVVKYLVNRGAEVNAKANDGKTPLDIAIEQKHNNVVEYLKKVKEERGKPVQRRRRHHHGDHNRHYGHLSRKPLAIDLSNQPEMATSSAARPSSWINDVFGWVKSSVSGLLSSKPRLSDETSSTSSPISQVDAKMDVNGTIMLLDLLIRKVTGQKYISTVDQSISPLEAQGYALNITKEFEKVVEQAGLKSGVSMHRLNIDYMEMQKEITRKIIGGKFNETLGILNSYVEKACPGREAGCPGRLSPKKFDKFITEFNNKLDVALNQPMQQISHSRNSTLEVSEVKEQQISLEPRSYLNNTSVQGHLAQGRDLRLR